MGHKRLYEDIIAYIAKTLGFKAIPKRKFPSYLLSKRLKKVISEYEIDCFFDVGANAGQYRDFLRSQVGYDGLIISFEPDPNNIRKLEKRSVEDRNWVIFGHALGRESEVRKFNLMKSSTFNSFLNPDNVQTSQFENMNLVIQSIDVEIHRLDRIFENIQNYYKIKNVFLKMDTQGFDLDVFEGASGCLNRIRAVQTEVSVTPIYKNMPSLNTSIEVFKSKGFEVSGLYSISESRFPHAIEFDCVYVPK